MSSRFDIISATSQPSALCVSVALGVIAVYLEQWLGTRAALTDSELRIA